MYKCWPKSARANLVHMHFRHFQKSWEVVAPCDISALPTMMSLVSLYYKIATYFLSWRASWVESSVGGVERVLGTHLPWRYDNASETLAIYLNTLWQLYCIEIRIRWIRDIAATWLNDGMPSLDALTKARSKKRDVVLQWVVANLIYWHRFQSFVALLHSIQLERYSPRQEINVSATWKCEQSEEDSRDSERRAVIVHFVSESCTCCSASFQCAMTSPNLYILMNSPVSIPADQ